MDETPRPSSTSLPSPVDGVEFPHVDDPRRNSPSFVDPNDHVYQQGHTSPPEDHRPSSSSTSHSHPGAIHATARDLRIASRSLRLSGPYDRTLQDIKRAKEYYVAALGDVPHTTLQHIHKYKLADRECVAYRVAIAKAELESLSRRRALIKAIEEARKKGSAETNDQLEILELMLGLKGSFADMEGDEYLQRATYEEELLELSTVDEEVKYVQEVVDLQGRMPSWETWEDSDGGDSGDRSDSESSVETTKDGHGNTDQDD